jgi:hypothetical protein
MSMRDRLQVATAMLLTVPFRCVSLSVCVCLHGCMHVCECVYVFMHLSLSLAFSRSLRCDCVYLHGRVQVCG